MLRNLWWNLLKIIKCTDFQIIRPFTNPLRNPTKKLAVAAVLSFYQNRKSISPYSTNIPNIKSLSSIVKIPQDLIAFIPESYPISRSLQSVSMASRTATKDIITLRGSAAIVSEFFGYAANSILYNRAVYPEESFARVKKYGLPMLLTQDEGVKSFISNLNAQLSEWLESGKLQRVVLVIMSKASGEVLERWNFSIETDKEVVEKGVSREKSDKEIMREIQAIMRQIASSITYLPCLDEPCVFDVLAYTDTDVAVPFTWVESGPKLIANPQMVKLHSFDTKIHKVDTLVSYKNDEWDEA